MIIWRLGWRNLWRNSRRSLITIAAVATAFVFLMILTGIVNGITVQMLENGTSLMVGDLQIHAADYLPDRNLYDWIGSGQEVDLERLLQDLEEFPGVEQAAPRVLGFALLSTGERSSGGQLLGVDPEREKQVSLLLSSLTEGVALSESPRRQILLGEILARALGAETGSEVALVTQAADGTLGNDLYEVCGVFRTGLVHLDRSLALLHLHDLQELLALESSQVHEIAVQVQSPRLAKVLAQQLNRSGILPPETVAESWEELLPQLKAYLEMASGTGLFLLTLVGLFAGLGVLNTMMMAVFERTREIGTLTALGLSPLRILACLLAESFFLGLLGTGCGFLLGSRLVVYLGREGLDLTRWTGELSMLDSRMDPVLKAVWEWSEFAWVGAGLVACTLLATLIPAVRAARLHPVEAMRAPTEG